MQQSSNRKYALRLVSALIGIIILGFAASFALPKVQQIQQESGLENYCGKDDVLLITTTATTEEKAIKQIISQEKLELIGTYSTLNTYAVKVSPAAQPETLSLLSAYTEIVSISPTTDCAN